VRNLLYEDSFDWNASNGVNYAVISENFTGIFIWVKQQQYKIDPNNEEQLF